MFKTLWGKLATVLLGLLCLLGALYVVLTFLTTRLYVQEITQKLHRELAVNLVNDHLPLQQGNIDDAALQGIFNILMTINPSIEVYLLDLDGRILDGASPPEKVQRQRVGLGPIQRFLQGDETFPILGDDPRHLNRQKVFSVAPVPTQGALEGYLYIVLASEEFDSVAHRLQGSYILRLSTWAIVSSAVFALLAGLLLFKVLTQRLQRLTAVVDQFRQSDLDSKTSAETLPQFVHAVTPGKGDEVDLLGSTFQAMAERILQQVQTLKNTDTLRRELIAHVSHDLRTPLAALHGYLETLLLKDTQLTRQEQRHYLEIAVRHSEHLGRLISALFELAKLDSQETEVRLESFSLAELTQDVVQKFRLTAEQTQQSLQTCFANDLPFVQADIGLIERVLDNLIQNALQHTTAGDEVTVTLKQTNASVIVSVTDSGPGIPPEEQALIFNRFYRAGDNRYKTTDGAGLGLAIAKRILDLHHRSIEVHSILGHGATFTFSLPCDND